MDKQESKVVITKVDSENFEAFLGLIAKLADYEKLAPPDEEAKKRLRRDCLSEKPKYQAFIGKSAANQSATPSTFSLTQASSRCQRFFLKTYLSSTSTDEMA